MDNVRVAFEIPHLRAAEKALALLKGLTELQERVYLGHRSSDNTLSIEFLEELVDNMRAETIAAGESRRVDHGPRLEVLP